MREGEEMSGHKRTNLVYRHTKTCKICGKTFEGWNKDQKYCSVECKKINDRAVQEKYRKSLKEKEALAAKKRMAINDINEEARKQGMTYGQYVAMMNL